MPNPSASSPDLPALHGHTHRPKSQGGTDPIEFPASGGGWPTMHNLLDGTSGGGRDRFEQNITPGTATKWRTFYDPNKWGTFTFQNSDNAGTTFYNGAYVHFGMYLGPADSWWGLYNVADQRADGGQATFKFATDPNEPGLTDPTTLTFYDVTGNTDNWNGAPVTGVESGLSVFFQVGGADGAQLTANATSHVFNGGAGFWWLKVLVSDGGSSDYAVVLRDLRLIRILDTAGAVN